EVVLCPAVDVVERPVVVNGDVVELRHRQIADELPVASAVETLVDAAVAANEIVIGVLRVDPDAVVVDMLPGFAERTERPATVVGNLNEDIHDIDTISVLWVDDKMGIVLGLLVEAVAFLPGFAAIQRAENASVAVDRLDNSVDAIGIRGRGGEANASEVAP